MKTFFTSLFALSILLSQAQNDCGIITDFSYEVVGDQIYFTNLSQSTLGQVDITGYYWEFSDGNFSNDMNPIHTMQDPCGLEVCLFVQADSSGFGNEYCYPAPLCVQLDLGFEALELGMTYVFDEATESVILDFYANGGYPPYAYAGEINNNAIGTWTAIEVPFNGFAYAVVEVCVVDEMGCMACQNTVINNPFLICDIELTTTLVDNYVVVTPTLTVGNEVMEEYQGILSIGQDSIYNVYGNTSTGLYIGTLGVTDICYEPSEFTISTYPNCPSSVCTQVDVQSFASNCSALFAYSQLGNSFYFNNVSTGFYDEIIWDFGNGEISTEETVYVILMPGVYVVSLTATNSETNCTSTYQETITVMDAAHICMHVYLDENQNGNQDADEGPVDSLVVWWGNVQWLILNGELDVYTYPGSGCISFGDEMTYASVTEMPNWDGCFMSNTFLLELAPGEELCPIDIGIYLPHATVCGTYYYDDNNNGVMDGTESGVAYAEISLEYQDQTEVITTDANGNYCLELPVYTGALFVPWFNGEFSSLIEPSYYNLYTSFDETMTLDFGLYLVTDAVDVGVSMSQGWGVTPGMETTYSIAVQNYSNLATTCVVNAYNAPGQTTSYVDDGGVSTSTGATWNIDLEPYGAADMSYWAENATNMVLGESVIASASVIPTGIDPDVNMNNNTSILQMQVIGSYDPNNKLVNPAGEGPTGRISPSVDSFVYTINFQNTGSAPAMNIRVEDILQAELDPTTIELLQTSHPATMIVNGQHVEWNFYDIQLPDSMSNEAESHGHLTFRIAPANPLVDGMEISNSASIYFDFNEPIVTAPALVTVDETIGVGDQLDEKSLIVFPNPVEGDIIYLQGIEGLVHVYDAAGRVVQTARLSKLSSKMTIGDLKPGLYLIKEIESGIGATFVRN